MNDGTLNNTTTFGYDSSGNLSTVSYPNNTEITYGYDTQNQIAKKRITGQSYLSVNAHWTMLSSPFWMDLHFGPGNFVQWNSYCTTRPTGAKGNLAPADPGNLGYSPWPCSGVAPPAVS